MPKMHTIGDLRNLLSQFLSELRKVKYNGHIDHRSLCAGIASAYLPLLHYILFECYTEVTQFISDHGYDLRSKKDRRFLEGLYKLLRDQFQYKPVLSRDQFFHVGFAARKLVFVTDVFRMIQQWYSSTLKQTNNGTFPTTVVSSSSAPHLSSTSYFPSNPSYLHSTLVTTSPLTQWSSSSTSSSLTQLDIGLLSSPCSPKPCSPPKKTVCFNDAGVELTKAVDSNLHEQTTWIEKKEHNQEDQKKQHSNQRGSFLNHPMSSSPSSLPPPPLPSQSHYLPTHSFPLGKETQEHLLGYSPVHVSSSSSSPSSSSVSVHQLITFLQSSLTTLESTLNVFETRLSRLEKEQTQLLRTYRTVVSEKEVYQHDCEVLRKELARLQSTTNNPTTNPSKLTEPLGLPTPSSFPSSLSPPLSSLTTPSFPISSSSPLMTTTLMLHEKLHQAQQLKHQIQQRLLKTQGLMNQVSISSSSSTSSSSSFPKSLSSVPSISTTTTSSSPSCTTTPSSPLMKVGHPLPSLHERGISSLPSSCSSPTKAKTPMAGM